MSNLASRCVVDASVGSVVFGLGGFERRHDDIDTDLEQ